jgi:DeoR/GlpR family transcriptional regulator of sugar metabolism
MRRTSKNAPTNVIALVRSHAARGAARADDAHARKGGAMMEAVDQPMDDPKGIDARERRRRLLALLDEHEYVGVTELAHLFGVTPMSVRRDLAMLEERGLLARVRGGAVTRRSPRATGFFANALRAHTDEKTRIAAATVELLEPNMVTFFYSGTTVAAVAAALTRPLRTAMTVATTSLAVLEETSRWDSPHLVVLGGTYLPEYMAFVGPQTIRSLRDLSADTAIVGCDGLSADGGLTTPHQLVAEVGSMMIDRARRVIAVADSSKIGRLGFTPIAPSESVDVLVTDRGADREEVEALRARGVEVVLA